MDDRLRELERRVTAGGTLDEVLALAHALERAGRIDDATATLLRRVDEASVRRELGRIADRTHRPWRRSSFADVGALARVPRIVWSEDLAVEDSSLVWPDLLGIFVVNRAWGPPSFLVLDPRDGREKPVVDGVPELIANDTVWVARESEMVPLDVWTFELRGEIEDASSNIELTLGGSHAIAATRDGIRGRALRPDATSWFHERESFAFAVGGDRVYVAHNLGARIAIDVLAATTGEPLSRWTPRLGTSFTLWADDLGCAIDSEVTRFLDRDGRVTWEAPAEVVALSRDLALVRDRKSEHVEVRARGDGSIVTKFDAKYVPFSLARGVVYAVVGTPPVLIARSPSEELWRVPLSEIGVSGHVLDLHVLGPYLLAVTTPGFGQLTITALGA